MAERRAHGLAGQVQDFLQRVLVHGVQLIAVRVLAVGIDQAEIGAGQLVGRMAVWHALPAGVQLSLGRTGWFGCAEGGSERHGEGEGHGGLPFFLLVKLTL